MKLTKAQFNKLTDCFSGIISDREEALKSMRITLKCLGYDKQEIDKVTSTIEGLDREDRGTRL